MSLRLTKAEGQLAALRHELVSVARPASPVVVVGSSPATPASVEPAPASSRAERGDTSIVVLELINDFGLASTNVLEVFELIPDPITREVSSDLHSLIRPPKPGEWPIKPVSIVTRQGSQWRIKEGDQILAELAAGEAIAQPVSLKELISRYNTQRSGSKYPISFEQTVIDPEGMWIPPESSMMFEQFWVQRAGEGLLDVELTSGSIWRFAASMTRPNGYDLVKAYDDAGRIDHTDRAGSVTLDFAAMPGDINGTPIADLRSEGQSIRLATTGKSRSVDLVMAEVRHDQDWARWVATEQGDGTWKRWTARDRAETSIVGGFSGSLLGSQRPSYRGYNVRNMAPNSLGKHPGVNPKTSIFEVTDDRSKEWSTYGTEYRIPWTFMMEQAPYGRSVTDTRVFFSEQERREYWNLSVQAGDAKLGKSESESAATTRKTVTIGAYKWASEYWLILNKKHARLSREFQAKLFELKSTLARQATDDNARWLACSNFFELHGTHYPISTLYGGRAGLECQLDEATVSRALESKWSAGYESETTVQAGAKGVSVSKTIRNAVNFESGSSSSSRTGISNERNMYFHEGGEGGDFDSWDIGANKNLQPIKVDLRRLDELIVPRLLGMEPSQAGDVAGFRAQFSKQLNRYLTQPYKPRDTQKPKLFKIGLKSFQLTKDNDDDTGTPGTYGTIQFQLWKNGVLQDPLTEVKWAGDDAGGDDTTIHEIKVQNATAWQVSTADRGKNPLKLNEDLAGLSTTPRTVVVPARGLRETGQGFEAIYGLNEYMLRLYVNLYDADGSATDDHIVYFRDFNLLTDVEGKAGMTNLLTDTISKAGFADFTFTLEVSEVGLAIEDLKDGLPEFPSLK